MYKDIGIDAIDTCFFKKTTLIYDAAGAREFQRRYLIDKAFNPEEEFTFRKLKDQQDFIDEKRKKILTIFNSQTSLQYLKKLNENVIKRTDKAFNLSKENKNLIKLLDEVGFKRTIDLNEKVTIQALNQYIDSFFSIAEGGKGKTRFVNAKGYNMNKIELERQPMKDLLQLAGVENARNKKEVEQVRSYLKTQFMGNKIYRTMARSYWDYFLKKEYNARVIDKLSSKYTKEQMSWLELTPTNREDFIDLFCATIEKYPNISFDVNAPMIRGFGLEYGMKMSSDMVGEQALFKIIGQEFEEKILKEYQGKNKPVKNSPNTGMSASDMIIYGKENNGKRKEYRLQLKNNLNEESNFLAFKVQGDIFLSTFLETAFADDAETKKTLEYLLLNICYLKQYGLGPFRYRMVNNIAYYEGASQNLFQWKQDEKLKRYIQIMLMTAYSYILSADFLEQLDNADKTFKGNIAFIYKGQYFIPIAAFLVGAYSLLLKLVYYQKNFNSSSIGGVMSPVLKNASKEIDKNLKIPTTGMAPKKFQEEKMHLVYDGKKYDQGQKRYPDNLVNFSANQAENFYTDIKMRLSIGLSIDALERILK